MRIATLLLLCSVQVFGFLGQWRFVRNVTENKEIDSRGRAFVTMLGYPPKCQRKGSSHSCTLSVTCWLAGGSSEEGCGSNPWLVGCCVIKKKGFLNKNQVIDQNDIKDQMDSNEDSVLQRRNDDFIFECGISANRILSKRIIGGKDAYFGQFPWQAHIKISAYQCGGVLVSSKYVATAAHCIIKAKLYDIVVYLGELDTQDTGSVVELAPAELHRVKTKIIHPKFQFRRTQPDRFDVALLELVTEAGSSYHIAPICLPEGHLDLRNREGVVAGWGKTKPTAELMGTNILRSATVPILDIKECISWHKTKHIKVELFDEMICAGHADGHHDACLGDSGGPLIVLEGGRWTLAGLISAGFGCGEPHQPGIYHSTSITADWIRSIIYS
ncbi:trypsin-7 isoform X1 [Onthophagus taurus]|uniref:trypsin-7 isoform X1 n=2 Tax=Onthophagus taurus TaxID=166361 RepID=UPI0039BE3C0D